MPSRDFEMMFPEIGEADLVVSQSTISSLEISPCRWYYGPYRGHKLEPSEAMFFGTVEHAIIEEYVTGKIDHFQLVSPQTALRVAYEVAEEDGIDLAEKMPDKSRRADWFIELAEAANAWYLTYWIEHGQYQDILEVEEPYAMEITQEGFSRKVWFVTGGIDMVIEGEEGPILTDWKTSGRGWSNGQGTGSQQKEAYAMLYENKHGVLPNEMVFVVYDRQRRTWGAHPAKITEQSIEAYKHRLDGWVRYMLDPFHLCTPSDGKKRGWWAKPAYNDVIDRCPSCRHLGDEFDRSYPNGRKW